MLWQDLFNVMWCIISYSIPTSHIKYSYNKYDIHHKLTDCRKHSHLHITGSNGHGPRGNVRGRKRWIIERLGHGENTKHKSKVEVLGQSILLNRNIKNLLENPQPNQNCKLRWWPPILKHCDVKPKGVFAPKNVRYPTFALKHLFIRQYNNFLHKVEWTAQVVLHECPA